MSTNGVDRLKAGGKIYAGDKKSNFPVSCGDNRADNDVCGED